MLGPLCEYCICMCMCIYIHTCIWIYVQVYTEYADRQIDRCAVCYLFESVCCGCCYGNVGGKGPR